MRETEAHGVAPRLATRPGFLSQRKIPAHSIQLNKCSILLPPFVFSPLKFRCCQCFHEKTKFITEQKKKPLIAKTWHKVSLGRIFKYIRVCVCVYLTTVALTFWTISFFKLQGCKNREVLRFQIFLYVYETNLPLFSKLKFCRPYSIMRCGFQKVSEMLKFAVQPLYMLSNCFL